jgi:hypothetical protein
MTMRTASILRLVLIGCLAAAGTRSVRAEETDTLLIQTEIYRIKGDVSGDTSLTDDIWGGSDVTTASNPNLVIFTVADLEMADRHLSLDERGWRWDVSHGYSEFPARGRRARSSGVLEISQPRMMLNLGQEGRIFIGSEMPLEYFERRADGLYEHKLRYEETGLSVKVTARDAHDGRILLDDLSIVSSIVGERKPLEGTGMNIGEPIIDRQEFKTDIHATSGRDYGMLLYPKDGQGALLVRLRVHRGGENDGGKIYRYGTRSELDAIPFSQAPTAANDPLMPASPFTGTPVSQFSTQEDPMAQPDYGRYGGAP